MGIGGLPGRDEALELRIAAGRKDAKTRSTRRMFIGLAFGGVLGACAGGAAVHAAQDEGDGAAPTDGAQEPLDPELAELREIATGPLDKLLIAQTPFLAALGAKIPGDDPIWVGYGRLCQAAAVSDPRAQRSLEKVLLAISKRPGFPRHAHGWVDLMIARHR